MGDRFYWIGIQQSISNFVIAQNQVNLPTFLAKSVEPLSRRSVAVKQSRERSVFDSN